MRTQFYTGMAAALLSLTIISASIAQARDIRFDMFTRADVATGISSHPWAYDPGSSGLVSSEWVTYIDEYPTGLPSSKDDCQHGGYKNFPLYTEDKFRNQGECIKSYNSAQVPQPANDVLVLSKDDVGDVIAGLEITGTAGITLEQLSFDYNGYCGEGAPRFNVFTTSGTYYFFGCLHGKHTERGSGWQRVEFDQADAVPADGSPAFPGFGKTKVTGIEIVMDEVGTVMLDNVSINGMVIQQSSAQK